MRAVAAARRHPGLRLDRRLDAGRRRRWRRREHRTLRRARRQRRFVGTSITGGSAATGGASLAGFDFERSQSSGPDAGSLAAAGKRGSAAGRGCGGVGRPAARAPAPAECGRSAAPACRRRVRRRPAQRRRRALRLHSAARARQRPAVERHGNPVELPDRGGEPDQDETADDRDRAGDDQRVAEAERIDRNAKSDGHKAGGSDQQADCEQNQIHNYVPYPTTTRAAATKAHHKCGGLPRRSAKVYPLYGHANLRLINADGRLRPLPADHRPLPERLKPRPGSRALPSPAPGPN